MKRNLLLGKIENIFKLKPLDIEIKNLNKLLFLEDDLEIKVLDLKDIKVSFTEDELKNFWEQNKNNYMSSNSYELEIVKIPVSLDIPNEEKIQSYFEKNKIDFKKSDGKVKNLEEARQEVIKALNIRESKKSALKKYLKMKKNEEKNEERKIIFEDQLGFKSENLEKIKTAKKGSLIKPFLEGNEYIIVKVFNQFNPKVLPYERVKKSINIDYNLEKGKRLLKLKAQKELEKFKGDKIGFVSQNSFDKIVGLNEKESKKFLELLFQTDKKEGSIDIDNKIVLYKVHESQFAQYDATKDITFENELIALQNSDLIDNLIKKLETKYSVKTNNIKEK